MKTLTFLGDSLDCIRDFPDGMKQAASRCGLTQPRINDLLNGRIDKFSLDALVNINAQLGQALSFQFAVA